MADRAFREQVRQVAGIGVQIQSGRWLVDVERAQDAAEAKQLMDQLEGEILPLFFDRDDLGRPMRWLDWVSRSIEVMGPRFSAHRMVREYVEHFYEPAGAQLRS